MFESLSSGHPDSYSRCCECGMIVSGASPCCGKAGAVREEWPAPFIRKQLSAAGNETDEKARALLLHGTLELLFEKLLLRTLLDRSQSFKDARAVLANNVSPDERLKLYHTAVQKTAEEVLAPKGLGAFAADYPALSVLRNVILAQELSRDRKPFASQEQELVRRLLSNCLPVFVELNNACRARSAAPEPGEMAPVGEPEAVLVVDDEYGVRTCVSEFIHREGLTVYSAESGEQAVELYRQHLPGLVLLDVMLPGIDGITVLDRIKKINPKAHVYFLTGVDGVSFHQEAERLGAEGHFLKPVTFEDILKILKRA